MLIKYAVEIKKGHWFTQKYMNKNTGISIVASGRALPTRSYTNDELKSYMDTDDEWIYKRTGIKQRGFCDPRTEDQISLSIEAAAKAIAKAQDTIQDFNVNDIGAVLVASCSGTYRLPSTACMVQKALGLSRSVLAYDMNAACSGFVYAVMTARGLLLSGDYKYCLIIASEQLSAEMDLHDRSTGILFADGAGAVIVSLDESKDAAPYAQAAWSDGNDEVLCCGIEPGGTLASGADFRAREPVIRMNGHEVFRFASNAIPETIDELLKVSGLSLEDIDYVLCHQANARIIDFVRKKYKGHEAKFLVNIEKHGNTSSASIPILLDEMIEDGVISAGSSMICVGFGAGLTWGGVVVRII